MTDKRATFQRGADSIPRYFSREENTASEFCEGCNHEGAQQRYDEQFVTFDSESVFL